MLLFTLWALSASEFILSSGKLHEKSGMPNDIQVAKLMRGKTILFFFLFQKQKSRGDISCITGSVVIKTSIKIKEDAFMCAQHHSYWRMMMVRQHFICLFSTCYLQLFIMQGYIFYSFSRVLKSKCESMWSSMINAASLKMDALRLHILSSCKFICILWKHRMQLCHWTVWKAVRHNCHPVVVSVKIRQRILAYPHASSLHAHTGKKKKKAEWIQVELLLKIKKKAKL